MYLHFQKFLLSLVLFYDRMVSNCQDSYPEAFVHGAHKLSVQFTHIQQLLYCTLGKNQARPHKKIRSVSSQKKQIWIFKILDIKKRPSAETQPEERLCPYFSSNALFYTL